MREESISSQGSPSSSQEGSDPRGWRLVPDEPTNPMLVAACDVGPDTNSGCFSFDDAFTVYRAMLSAAPSPPESGADDGAATRHEGKLRDDPLLLASEAREAALREGRDHWKRQAEKDQAAIISSAQRNLELRERLERADKVIIDLLQESAALIVRAVREPGDEISLAGWTAASVRARSYFQDSAAQTGGGE